MKLMYTGNRATNLGKKFKNVRFGTFFYNEEDNLDCLMAESLVKILDDAGYETIDGALDGEIDVLVSKKEDFEELKDFFCSFKKELKDATRYSESKGDVSSLLAN